MGIASSVNQFSAKEFLEKEATQKEIELLKQGKWEEVQNGRNEYWTPGFVQWVVSFAKGKREKGE